MDIGVHMPHMGPFASGPNLTRLGRVADEVGFHSVWFSDHLVIPVEFTPLYPYDPTGRFPVDHRFAWVEPFASMAFVAGATERVLVGSSVMVVPYRHPVVLGAQISGLQFLSGGRVILGAGAGWMPEEFDIVGVPHAERGRRLDECLDVIMAMCVSSPAQHDGDFYRLPPAGTLPLPDRPPPVWIGGNTDVALRRAARWQGWHGFQVGPDEVRDAASRLPGGVAVSVRTTADPTNIDATVARVRELEEAGATHVTLDVWADPDATETAWRALGAALIGS